MRAVRFRQAHGLPLKPLNSPRWIFLICLNWLSPLPTSFRDSCPCECAFCSIRIPPINYNRKLSGLLNPAVQSLNSTPAAAREYTGLRSPFPRSGYQIEAERNTAARAKGTWTSYTESEFVLCALADNDDKSDDNLPFLDE